MLSMPCCEACTPDCSFSRIDAVTYVYYSDGSSSELDQFDLHMKPVIRRLAIILSSVRLHRCEF
jgi:hypothetical protein